MKKFVIFSGIQPSGFLTIGHYISVLSQWKKMQNNFNCFFCIADLHSITKNKTIFNIKNNIFHILSVLLSIEIDCKNNIIFLQSKIPEHLKLFWILSSFVKYNLMLRMHQFKKNIKNNNISLGTFTYPILMSSDILLYDTDIVPIGYDQIQHVEITRKISRKFNNIYKNIFKIPNYSIIDNFCIMSLINPKKKMSKSDINKNNYISILDSDYDIKYKIDKSITDSNNPPLIKYDLINKPGISNLLNIVSRLKNISIKEIENEFVNKNYNQFKKYVSDILINKLSKIRNKYFIIRNNESNLIKLLSEGNIKAKIIAKEKFSIIKKCFYKNNFEF